MITTEDIQRLLGTDIPVMGGDGSKIGAMGQVFLDAVSGEPAWVTVHTGLFGRSESFVPLTGAVTRGDEIHVPFSKDAVKHAPRTQSAGGRLSPDEERALYRHYGLLPDDATVTDEHVTDEHAADERAAGRHATDEHSAADEHSADDQAPGPHLPDQHASGRHVAQDADDDRRSSLRFAGPVPSADPAPPRGDLAAAGAVPDELAGADTAEPGAEADVVDERTVADRGSDGDRHGPTTSGRG